MAGKELTKKELEEMEKVRTCDICLQPIDPAIDGKPVYIKTRRGTAQYICLDCISKTQKGACKDA
ncbi:hypothetical protein [uncultured Robinsoniella sp.]|uniref:hypothetical protein n=1 Tax=uncultured Robinsoniella sp. TaxID=904190 RepID=UPI00374E408D